MVKISAIICTYNRSVYLSKAIESLINQSIMQDEYEIIIVDNRSTDQTKKIVENFSEKYKNINYVYEEIQGLSSARNKGAKTARGEYIAYLDDDAEACKEWLEKFIQIFDTFPGAACLGGKIEVLWPDNKRPDWLNEDYDFYYGKLDLGNEVKVIRFPESPYGGNFCIRKNVFETIGYFSESLGRKKDILSSSEEIEFVYRINKSNFDVLYVPEAKIFHHALSYRINKNYLLDRIYWNARSNVIVEIKAKKFNRRRISMNFLLDVKELIIGIIVLIKYNICSKPIFDQKIKIKYFIGKIQQEFIEMIIHNKNCFLL